MMNPIIIGADHAGFSLKEAIKAVLAERGFEAADMGTASPDAADYPEFGGLVAEKVSSGEYPRGILACGSGVGMSIVANKFPRVRAVLALDEETARMSRRHNDTNVLVLAGRKTDTETAVKIMDAWLTTPFEGGRHQRRLDRIQEIEQRLCRNGADRA